MARGTSKESPLQTAIKAMKDEDGVNGKRLSLEQIAGKYYGGDKTHAVFAISMARQYTKAFSEKAESA